jgi:selenocysteine-specific elongation factor
MTVTHFIIATAGHVDHGKSSLVKALTGTDPDRLPEEKARGITLDLGFAPLRLTSPAQSEEEFAIGIVDVPGHEDLVKNMVAGVGAIDLALLIVAADDGWMPQTEEHLQILDYMGVRTGVVVLTKTDRIPRAAESTAVDAIRKQLHDSPLASAPIVPVSVVTGRGLDELKQTIATSLTTVRPAADVGKPRLWIDRAFTLHGVGRVVTGTLTGGTLRTGNDVTIAGEGRAWRIRGLHSHNRPQSVVFPGMRVAINLTAADPSRNLTTVVQRGALVTAPDAGVTHDSCNVWLSRSSRLERSGARALGHETIARLHVGTAAVLCRIILPDRPQLAPGEQGVAQLRLERPLSLVGGDRFVLRDPSARSTIGGGVVLEPGANRQRFRSEEHQRFLHALRMALDDPEAFVRAHLQRASVIPRSILTASAPFARERLDAALEALAKAGATVIRSDVVAAASMWRDLLALVTRAVDAHHATHPTQNGMPLVQVRALVRRRLCLAELADLLVTELTAGEFELIGAAIRRRGFRPSLPPHLRGAVERLVSVLARSGLNAPGRKELAPSSVLAEALEFLLKTGQAVALGPEVVVGAAAFHEATGAIRAHLARHEVATVSELKQLLGTSRRIMVPLLERLDHDGVTIRDGEHRRLRSRPPVGAFSGRSELARD